VSKPIDSRDRETGVPCPKCAGKGWRMLKQTSGAYRKEHCDLCGKTGIVTLAVARTWRTKNPGSLR
jgi:hypothetical protein